MTPPCCAHHHVRNACNKFGISHRHSTTHSNAVAAMHVKIAGSVSQMCMVQVALITGGGSGIGFEITRQLGACRFTLISMRECLECAGQVIGTREGDDTPAPLGLHGAHGDHGQRGESTATHLKTNSNVKHKRDEMHACRPAWRGCSDHRAP